MMNFNKNKKAMPAGRRGFTFIELIIAIFIFSLMMIAVAGIFSNSFSGYSRARVIQKDLEDAQFIMNQMAKILRTSSVVDNPSDGQSIAVFDYSQEKCIKYAFNNSKIKYGQTSAPAVGAADREDFEKDRIIWCTAHVPSNLDSMANLNVTGKFNSVKSESSGVLGKITISMSICSNAGCTSDKVNIQSSVSLRDYYKAGI